MFGSFIPSESWILLQIIKARSQLAWSQGLGLAEETILFGAKNMFASDGSIHYKHGPVACSIHACFIHKETELRAD